MIVLFEAAQGFSKLHRESDAVALFLIKNFRFCCGFHAWEAIVYLSACYDELLFRTLSLSDTPQKSSQWKLLNSLVPSRFLFWMSFLVSEINCYDKFLIEE